MRHYSEVELLEHYYLGGEAAAIAEHVGACAECTARFERLRQKLSCSAVGHRQQVDAKPDTFWSRQRTAVLRELQGRPERRPAFPAVWRFAVAAVLTLLTAGLIVLTMNEPNDLPQQIVPTAQHVEPTETTVAVLDETQADPWESEGLQPYGELVEWESWLAEEAKGGTS